MGALLLSTAWRCHSFARQLLLRSSSELLIFWPGWLATVLVVAALLPFLDAKRVQEFVSPKPTQANKTPIFFLYRHPCLSIHFLWACYVGNQIFLKFPFLWKSLRIEWKKYNYYVWLGAFLGCFCKGCQHFTENVTLVNRAYQGEQILTNPGELLYVVNTFAFLHCSSVTIYFSFFNSHFTSERVFQRSVMHSLHTFSKVSHLQNVMKVRVNKKFFREKTVFSETFTAL